MDNNLNSWIACKIAALDRRGEPKSSTDLEKFHQHNIEVEGNLQDISLSCVMKAQYYIDKHYYGKALNAIDEGFREAGADIGCLRDCREQMDRLITALTKRAYVSPGCSEIGNCYERLVKNYGGIGFEMHVLALRHFLEIGAKEKSEQLMAKLDELIPNFPLYVAVKNGRFEKC